MRSAVVNSGVYFMHNTTILNMSSLLSWGIRSTLFIVFAVITVLWILYTVDNRSNLTVTAGDDFKKPQTRTQVVNRTKTISASGNNTQMFPTQGAENAKWHLENSNIVRECLTGKFVREHRQKSLVNIYVPAHGLYDGETDVQRKQSFIRIYENKEWSGKGSVSGPGSNIDTTENMRQVLHHVIIMAKDVLQKDVIRLLDIPCGDLTWMEHFLKDRKDVIYTGIDIVPELIQSLNTKFKDKANMMFIEQDIAKHPLMSSYDVILCRHLTQHLTEMDTLRTLTHISQSGSHFLLLTTYSLRVNTRLAKDAQYRHRPQNMEIPPYALVAPLCVATDIHGASIGLWRLPLKQVMECINVKAWMWKNEVSCS